MVRFSEVFEFLGKSRIKAGEGRAIGKYPFYTSSREQTKYLDYFNVQGKSLIFGTGGDASIHFNDSKFSVSTDCLIAQPIASKETVTRFYYYFLKGNIHILERGFRGAGLKHISKTYISQIELPKANVEYQKKVVGILDCSDAIRQKRKQSLRLLDELLGSAFFYIFGDINSQKNQGTTKSLGAISEVVSGVTKGRKFNQEKTVMVPYMRVANVQDGFINVDDLKEIEVLPSDVEKFRLFKGDILLTEGGDPDKLGRGAVWAHDIRNCIHQNHIFRVRVNNVDEIEPIFLSALIGSSYGKKYFLRAAKQTTGIATINSTQLKNFPVIIPPIALQRKYIKIYTKVGQMKDEMKLSLFEMDNHFNALAQRTFREAENV